MRGKRVCLLVAAIAGAAAVTACGGGPASTAASGSPTAADATSRSTASAAAVPPGYQRVGGAAQGISVAVPASWVPVNLAKETIQAAAKKLRLSGVSASTIISDMEQIQSKHGIIVFDVKSAYSNSGHFTTNLNAFCLPSGVTNAGAAAIPLLKAEVVQSLRHSLHATGISQRGTRVGGVPGLATSYKLKSAIGTIAETQLEVLPKPDKACFVTLTGPPKLPAKIIAEAAATARYP